MKSWVFLGVSLAAALLGACATPPPPPSAPSPWLGHALPSFEQQTLSGNPVISASFEGHPVVVTFVATKNEPSERTLRAAQAVYSDDRELVVVAIFRHDGAEGAIPLAARLGLHFPVVVDTDGAIWRRFQVEGEPSTFVADTRGHVRWVGGADLDVTALSRAVKSAE